MLQLKKSNNKLQKYLLATTSITAMLSSMPAAAVWADINGGDQYISADLTLDPAAVFSTDNEARFVSGVSNYGGAIINSSGSNYKGVLRFDGGHDFLAGLNGNKDVGAPGAALKLIQLDGTNAHMVSFAGNVYAQTVTFTNDASFSLGDGGSLTATDITATNTGGKGVLYLHGSATITGNMGTSSNPLRLINAVGGAGTTVTLIGDTYANAINTNDASTIEFSGNNTYKATFTNASAGKIKLSQSGAATIDGTFANNFNSVTVASTGTTTFTEAIQTSVLDFAADGTVIMADGKNLVLGASGVSNTTGTAGKGSLVFLGDSTVNAPIGTTNKIYAAYLAGPAGKTVEFQDQADLSYITFNHPTDGVLGAAADSTLVFSGNKTHDVRIITANNNQGTIKFTNSGSARIKQVLATTGSRMKEIIVDDAIDGSATDITFNDVYTDIFSFNTDSTIRFYETPASTHSLVTTNGIKNTRGDGTNVGTIDNNHNAVVLYGDIGESGAGKGLKMIKNSSTTASTWIDSSVYATDMHFAADSTIKLTAASANSTINITNGITTSAAGQGILQLANSANTLTITGDVGGHVVGGASDSSLTLKKIDVNNTGTTEFQGHVYADVVDFSADGTVIMADGKNLVLGASGITNSGVVGKGNLIFLGDSTVNAPISTANRIYGLYLAGISGKTVELQDKSDIYYIRFDHPTDAGLAATADSTLIFSANKMHITAVDTANSSQGTVIFKNTGAIIVTGWLGNSTDYLKEVRLDDSSNGTGASMETVDIYADVVNFNTDSTIKSYQIVPATISITATNGIKNMKGGSNIGTIDNVKDIDNPWIITGNIGASGAGNGLKMIKNTTATAHTTITGNIYATDMYFGAESTMKLTAGSANSTINITNGITTATDETGTLELANTANTLTFTGSIGTSGAGLNKILVSSTGSSTFQSNVYSKDMHFSADGIMKLDAFAGSSTVTINNGITTSAAGQGTLELANTANSLTITGDIGGNTVGTGIADTSLTLKKVLVSGTGTTNAQGHIYADVLDFSADGTVTIADGKNLVLGASGVSNSTGAAGKGNLIFLGDSIVNAPIGTTNRIYGAYLAGPSGKTVEFQDQADIYYIVFTHPTDVALKAAADSTLVFSANKTNTIVIETATSSQGTVIFKNTGATTITGWIGGNWGGTPAPLKEIRIDDSSDGTGTSVTAQSMIADEINFNTDSTLKVYHLADPLLPANMEFHATNGIKNMRGGSNIGTLENDHDDNYPWLINANIGASGAGNGLKMIKNTVADAHTTFTGNVYATDMVFDADSTIKFTAALGNSTIDITNGITTATDGTGTLELANSANTLTFTKDVGASGTALKSITVSDTGSSTFQGHIYADVLDFAAYGIISIADGKNLVLGASGVTASGGDATGQLIFLGDSNVNADITSAGNRINYAYISGPAGKTITLEGSASPGYIAFGHPTDAGISPLADATVILPSSKTHLTAIMTQNASQGTVIFTNTGSARVSGEIGLNNKPLKEIRIDDSSDGTAASVVFANLIEADELNFNTDSTILTSYGAANTNTFKITNGIKNMRGGSNIGTINNDNDGTINPLLINANIGASGAGNGLRMIKNTVADAHTTFTGNVYATDMVFDADSTIKFTAALGNSTIDITNGITTNVAWFGILELANSANTLTFTKDIATDINTPLEKVEITAGGTSYVQGKIYTSTGVNFKSDGTLIFSDDGTHEMAAYTYTDNQGSLHFINSGAITIPRYIGGSAAGKLFKEIKIDDASDGTGASVAFSEVYAHNINVNTDSTIKAINASGNNVILAINGIKTSNDGKGTIENDQTDPLYLQADVGESTSRFKMIKSSLAGAKTIIRGNVYATDMHFANTGTMTFDGYLGNNIIDITNGITVAADDSGILELSNTANSLTFTNDVGAPGLALNRILVSSAGTSTFQGNIYLKELDLTQGNDATLIFSGDNKTYDFNISWTTGQDDKATLKFTGDSPSIISNIGNDNLHRISTFDLSDATGNGSIIAGGASARVHAKTVLIGDINMSFGDNIATGVGGILSFVKNSLNAVTDGIISIADGGNLDATVTNNTGTDSKGTITFAGTTTASSPIGANGAALKAININGANTKTVTLQDDTYATTTNFGSDGNLSIASGKKLTGNLTTTTADNGNIDNDTGGTITFAGHVGYDGTTARRLKMVKNSAIGSDTVFNGHVYSTDMTINDGSSMTFTASSGNSTVNITNGIKTTGLNHGWISLKNPTNKVTFVNDIGTGLGGGDNNVGYIMVQEAGTSEFQGNVHISATGTLAMNADYDATLIFSGDNKTYNFTKADTTGNTGVVGTIQFTGASPTINSVFGINNANGRIKSLDLKDATGTGSISGAVYAKSISVGDITLSFAGSIDTGASGSLDFTKNGSNTATDGTINIADGINLTTTVTNNTGTDSKGTITFAGTTTASSPIGANGAALKKINIDGNNTKTVTLQDDTYATTTNFGSDGNLKLASGKKLTGNLTVTTADNGNIDNDTGGTITFAGHVGYDGTTASRLKMIKNSVLNSVTVFDGHLYSTDLLFENGVSSTMKFTADVGNSTVTITNGITTDTTSTGVLELANTTNTLTFTNDGGAAGLTLNKVLVSGTGTSTFQGDIYSDAVDFTANGTIAINDGKNFKSLGVSGITTNTNDQGIVTYLGDHTIDYLLGSLAGNSLKQVNIDGASSKTVEAQYDIAATKINFGSDGNLKLTANKTLEASITTTTTGNGNLTFANSGAAKVDGDIGTSSNKLKSVTFNDALNGSGTNITATGNIYSDALTFTTDSELKVTGDKAISATITAGTDNYGTITFTNTGAASVTGQIGTSSNALKKLNIDGVGGTVTFNNSLYAKDLNFGANGAVTAVIGDGANLNITNGIKTSNDGKGTVQFSGSSVVNNDLGEDGTELKEIILAGAAGKTVEFKHNSYATDLIFSGDATAEFSGASKTNKFSGAIKTTVDGKGTLKFTDDQTLDATIGASGLALKAVSIAGSGKTLEVKQAIYSKSINFDADGLLKFTGAASSSIPYNITASSSNIGTLDLSSSSDITGVIGSSSAPIKEIKISGNSIETKFSKDIFATKLDFTGTGSKAIIKSESFDSLVTTNTSGQGELHLYSNVEVNKAVGESGKLISKLALGDGSTAHTITLNENIYANNLQINGAATLKLNKNITANVTESVTMGANSVLDLGKNTFTIKGDSNDGISAASVAKVNSTVYKEGTKYAMGGINNDTNTSSPIDVSKFVLNVKFDTPLPSGTQVLFAKFLSSGTELTGVEGMKLESLSNITKFELTYGNSGKELYLKSIREQTLTSYLTSNSSNPISSAAQSLANIFESNLSKLTGSAAQIWANLEMMDAEQAGQVVERLVPSNLGGEAVKQAVTSGISSTEQRVASLLSFNPSFLNNFGISSGNSYIDIGPWAQIFGSKSEQKKYKEIKGTKTNLKGISIGNDWQITENFLAGGAATILTSTSKATGNLSGNKADINSFLLSFYSGYNFKSNWFISNAAIMGRSTVNSRRVTGLNNELVAKGKSSAYNYGLSTGLGYRKKFKDNIVFVPKASLSYNVINNQDYTEIGAISDDINFNQKISGKHPKKLTGTIGGNVILNYTKNNWQVMPEIHANISRTLRSNRPFNKSLIDGLTEVITTREPKEIKQLYNIGTGIILKSATNTEIKAQYDFDIKKKYMSHTGSIKVKIKF